MLKKAAVKLAGLLGSKPQKPAPPVKPKRPSGDYISCEETVTAAQREGLAVGDYVEKIWDQRGAAARVIDQMAALGCFDNLKGACEIGPGTGRYLEKVLQRCPGAAPYVIYETAPDWAYWLEETYPVIRREADGKTLGHEGDAQLGLVHAHGVFTYLPFIHCFQYFSEMLRVTRPGGHIAFDFYALDQFDVPAVEKWMASGHAYPVVLPAELVEAFFASRGAVLTGKFLNKYGQGFSQYHVYQRR